MHSMRKKKNKRKKKIEDGRPGRGRENESERQTKAPPEPQGDIWLETQRQIDRKTASFLSSCSLIF